MNDPQPTSQHLPHSTLLWLGERVYRAAVGGDEPAVREVVDLASRIYAHAPEIFGAAPVRGRISAARAAEIAERAADAATIARDAWLAAGRPAARPVVVAPMKPWRSARARERLVSDAEIEAAVAEVLAAVKALPPALAVRVHARAAGGAVPASYRYRAEGDRVDIDVRVEVDGTLVVRARGARGRAVDSIGACIHGGRDVENHERALLRALGWTGAGGRWQAPRR